MRTSLYGGLESGAEQDAAAVASQLEESGAGSIGELDDDRLVQVVDPDGEVVAASEEPRLRRSPAPTTTTQRSASTA